MRSERYFAYLGIIFFCKCIYGDLASEIHDNLIRPTSHEDHYRRMMIKNNEENKKNTEEVKNNGTIKISSQIEIPDSEGLRLSIDVLKVIGKAAWEGMFQGFFPHIERIRRDTSRDWESNFLLDWILDIIGALLDKQKCSQKVACRAGKVIQEKLPGAQMMVVMAEAFIPPGALHWFGIVRQSVIDRSDSCIPDYICDFTQD